MSHNDPLLVIGRSGQLARALAMAGGARVIALGRPDIDLNDAASLNAALDRVSPFLVINAAAYTDVNRAESDAAGAMALNATGPGNLAALCAKRALPLLHISTDYVFDGTKGAPYGENDAPAPLGVYGRTKRAGEMAVIAANPRHIMVRTAWVHSPFGKNFVKTMIQLAMDQKRVSVVDDQFGNPTFAPHLAQAILDIVNHIRRTPDFAAWGMYHLAGSGRTSWAGLAKEIFAISKALGGPVAEVLPIPGSHYPSPVPRPENSCLKCDKAQEVFGTSLPDWRDGTRACVHAVLTALSD